jgi:Family of unknown function (DUF6361)
MPAMHRPEHPGLALAKMVVTLSNLVTSVWLDYSERERRKMLDVVDLFREHDTRDELGIGSVRDGFPSFSSRLFIVQGKW